MRLIKEQWNRIIFFIDSVNHIQIIRVEGRTRYHEDVSDELSRFIVRVSINRVRVALNRDAREE